MSNRSWRWSKILTTTCSLFHLDTEFHQECLNESTSWQKKLAGVTVNPLLRESLLLLPLQMNWHLKEEKEPHALAKIVTVGGGGIFMTTRGLPGLLTGTAHCVYPASVVSGAPAHGAVKFSSASQAFSKLSFYCIAWTVWEYQVNNQLNQFAIQSILISPLINHSGHSCHIHTLISPLHLQYNGIF